MLERLLPKEHAAPPAPAASCSTDAAAASSSSSSSAAASAASVASVAEWHCAAGRRLEQRVQRLEAAHVQVGVHA